MRQLLGALLVAGALAACGGGGDDADGETASDASTTTETTASLQTSESSVPAASSTTTARSDGGTTATTAASEAPAAAAAPEDDPFVPAGTYRYRQSGSARAGTQTMQSPPEGTLVVDQPAGARQTFHRYLDPEGEASDLTVEVQGGVARLVETVLRQGGQEVRCTFDPPMPTVDEVGETSTGHGECGELLDVDIEVRATGTTTVQLDGRSFDALVTETVTRTSGQVVSETRSLDHYLIELGIPAHTETESEGSFGTFRFEGEGTADLLSTVPS
jgi:hypothetical protein